MSADRTTCGPPVLGEMDLHLFREGSHPRLGDKLGSHRCLVDGESGIWFAVWAPSAESVSVVGTFNAWNKSASPLARGEAGIFAGFVGGVDEGALYKYHVVCRAGTGPVLEVASRVDRIFERYVKLVVVLRFTPYARLRLWVDDVLVGRARGEEATIDRLVGRQAIGADVLGRHRSALVLRELLLVGSPLGPIARARVSRRLDRHLQR